MKLRRLIGLTGVAAYETPIARLWGRRLEWPMLILALWISVQWYLEKKNFLPLKVVALFDWIIWWFFLSETMLLTILVKYKLRYLLHNWMNIFIIMASMPIFWHATPLAGTLRDLRLLLMLALLLRSFPSLRQILQSNHLGLTLLVALGVVLVGGIVISTIDPAFTSVWDGIWYAWVTIGTVGYGDVVPSSAAGRMLGAILIGFGMVFFALITANVAAFLLSSDVRKVAQEEGEMERRLDNIQQRLECLEQQIDRLCWQLENKDK